MLHFNVGEVVERSAKPPGNTSTGNSRDGLPQPLDCAKDRGDHLERSLERPESDGLTNDVPLMSTNTMVCGPSGPFTQIADATALCAH